MSFVDVYRQYNYDEIRNYIYSRTEDDVLKALSARKIGEEEFAALLSPAAEKMLEPIAQESRRITIKRFGKTIKLYVPIYLSNECSNACAYCGFNVKNKIHRATLTIEELEKELSEISKGGIRHLLMVSGEIPKKINVEYLATAAECARKYFSSIAIEIQPLSKEEYSKLYQYGIDGLVIYQETYNTSVYDEVHLGGKKKDFFHRLETPDRGASAGLRSVGIGALMGLSDFRIEEFFVGLHARYLIKNYWKTHITASFPRIRYAEGGYITKYNITDKNLTQTMMALRLFLHDVGLVVSTREPASLRDNLIGLGVTQMSAGSKTSPGGYSSKDETSGEQFQVEDGRSVEEFVAAVKMKGYDPVMKDWDKSFVLSAVGA